MSPSNIPTPGGYNVGPSGQLTNTGSMLGTTSPDICGGYDSYAAAVTDQFNKKVC
jgi:hypothetical protein